MRVVPPFKTFKTLKAKQWFPKVPLHVTESRLSRILKEYNR